MGEAVISCNSASGIVSDVNVGNIKFEIVPSSASCKIKITLGTEEFITESSRKWAANRWIECPKEAVKNLTEKSGGKNGKKNPVITSVRSLRRRCSV